MAGKIPAGEFNTRFTIDGSQPVETLKQIKSEVSSLTAGWKAQEAQLKSAGDAVGAAQAKYEGLGNAVSKQQSYINRLASEQKELDTSTNDGAQSYAKLERQIATATTRLNSMTAQQDRAKQSLNYQKSGLAELQSEYRQMTQTSESYVNRLEAEGKVQSANTVKIAEYRKAIANLDSQLKSQTSELSRIASESGKASDAYKRQEVRVNETATALAKAKNGMNNLNESMRKANPTVFDKIKEHIESTNKEAKKGDGLLKKFVAGGVISNAITNGWSNLEGQIKQTVIQGTALAEAGEQAKRVWESLGVSGSGADQLISQMRDLKGETNLTADQVSILQKRFYGMTGSVEVTKQMTEGVATLADKLRLNGDEAATMAKSLQRALNNGKLTTGVLTRMENSAPGLGSALAKASGMTEQAFNKMVASGQMSSQKLQALIVKIGGDSKQTFKDFGETAEGATQRLKGAWQNAEATMAKPIVSIQSTGINSIVNVLNSAAVQGLFKSTGVAIANIAKQAANVLNYIAAHQKDVGGIVTDLTKITEIIGETVWDTFKGIVTGIAKWLGLSGKNADAFKNPLGTIHAVLDAIVKNKSGIEATVKTVMALFAVKKALDFAVGVSRVYSALKKLSEIKLVSGGIKSLFGGGEDAVAEGTNVAEKELAGGAEETGTLSTGAKLLSKGTRLAKGLGTGFTLVSSGADAVSALTGPKQDMGANIGGSIGSLAGLATNLIPGVGPIASALLTPALSFVGEKAGKMLGAGIQKSLDANKPKVHVITPKVKVNVSADTKKLQTDTEAAVKRLNKVVARPSFNVADLSKERSQTLATYTAMSKAVDNYYNKKKAKSKSDLQELVKSGAMTQKQANTEYAKQAANYNKEAAAKKKAINKMIADSTNYHNQVQKIEDRSDLTQQQKWAKLNALHKKYVATMAKDEESLNTKVRASAQKGAKEQESIYQQLVNKRGKLDVDDLNKTIKVANQKYKAAVSTAKKQEKDVVQVAQDQYDKTVKAAEKAYKDHGGISKKEYKDIVANAKKQRDDTVSAAKDQYTQVTKHVTDEHTKVTAEATKQRKEAVKEATEKATQVGTEFSTEYTTTTGYSNKQASEVYAAAHRGNKKSTKEWSDYGTNTGNIFSGIQDWINSFTHSLGLGGGGGVPAGVSHTTNMQASTAAGTTGTVGRNLLSWVGEEGPEFLWNRKKGYAGLIGKNGPELRLLDANDQVLNAQDTSKYVHTDGVVSGFASGTSSILGFAKSVVDKAMSGLGNIADSVLNVIEHPIQAVEKLISPLINGFKPGHTGNLGSKLTPTELKKIEEALKKQLDQVSKSYSSSAIGNEPHAANAWLPIVEKLMQQMGANPPNGIESEAAAFVREIARESGGNPTIRQTVWDVNMANGDPAEGLLQFIPSTFMAYAVPGHTNILSGQDQIMATINAYMHSGAWDRIGTGENINFLANGGIATSPSIVGEAGAESVIPLSAIKGSRSYEMLGQTAAILAARDNLQQQSTDATTNNAQMLKLMEQNNDLVQMIITLITPKMTADDTQPNINLNQILQALGNRLGRIEHNTAYQTRRTGGARS